MNAPSSLSPQDRQRLVNELAQHAAAGTLSSQAKLLVLRDRSGPIAEMSGEMQRVVVDDTGLPTVVSEQHAFRIDCGHVITGVDQVAGVCSAGHIICHDRAHRLFTCPKCSRVHCDLCVPIIADTFVCPIEAARNRRHDIGARLFLALAFIIALFLILG